MIAFLGGSFVVIILVALAVIAWVISIYNNLIRLRNRYKNAFAQIDVQLKRRYDLIPNLVETVKGYLKHERETLEAVVQARSAAFSANQAASANPGDPNAMKNLSGAEGQLSGALGRLLVVCEAYPDLKANQNMMALQEELTSTENKVSFSRQAYNDTVMGFNNARDVFPTNIVAGVFNFSSAAFLEVDKPEERESVKVSF